MTEVFHTSQAIGVRTSLAKANCHIDLGIPLPKSLNIIYDWEIMSPRPIPDMSTLFN